MLDFAGGDQGVGISLMPSGVEHTWTNDRVGIDLDYTEFDNNRVALILNGTLVQLAPRRSRDSSRTQN